MEGLKRDLDKAFPPSALMKTCKRCKQQFNPQANTPRSCRYHKESYTGETAQRWLPPGENNGQGAKVVYHWWCCGSHDPEAPGCAYTTHEPYD